MKSGFFYSDQEKRGHGNTNRMRLNWKYWQIIMLKGGENKMKDL